MLCNKCGQEISAGDRFCQHCGAPVAPAEEAPLQQPDAAPQVVETPVEPVTSAEPVISTQPVTPATPVEDPGASTGKTAFILGLIGLIASAICSCSCILVGGIAPLICSILAVVLGNQAKRQSAAAGFENEKAKTAITLGIIGIVITVILSVIFLCLYAIGISEEFMTVYTDI